MMEHQDRSWEEILPMFRPEHLRRLEPGSGHVVEETGEDGKAFIALLPPTGSSLLVLGVSGRKGFPFLQRDKNPDGAVALLDSSGVWTVFIVECKHGGGDRTYEQAKGQLAWGALRARALLGALGIQPTTWVGVVASGPAPGGEDPARSRRLVDAGGTPEPVQEDIIRVMQRSVQLRFQRCRFNLEDESGGAKCLRGELPLAEHLRSGADS